MSDWLDELARLESEATEAKWYVVGPPWGDGGFIVSGNPDPHAGRYVCNTDDLLVMDDEEAKEHGASNAFADADFIAALRNSAKDLIEHARRAQELEQQLEAESDYQEGQRRELSYQREQAHQWEGNAIDAEKRVEELENAMKEVLLDLSGRQLPVPRETKELCEKTLGYRYDIKSDTWVDV